MWSSRQTSYAELLGICDNIFFSSLNFLFPTQLGNCLPMLYFNGLFGTYSILLRDFIPSDPNSGCELDSPLKSTNVDSIANDCDPLFGRLVLDGTDIPSADVLSEKFGKARNLTGELIVINTNLTNLAFLSNLRNITSVYNASG